METEDRKKILHLRQMARALWAQMYQDRAALARAIARADALHPEEECSGMDPFAKLDPVVAQIDAIVRAAFEGRD